MRRRPSPALVIACLALLVSLSGTGIAAVNALPRGSVGPAQLRTGAVNSLKVKDSSLKLLDLAAAERAQLKGDPGPAGPQGAKGDKGDRGAKGDTGAQGGPWDHRLDDRGEDELIDGRLPGSVGQLPGRHACTGGRGGTTTPGAGVTLRNSIPLGSNSGWLVVAEADRPGSGWSYTVDAVCGRVAG